MHGKRDAPRILDIPRLDSSQVSVRYRYDAERGVRHKTVELFIESVPWTPRARQRLWEID